jgi:hypothetical protein
MGWVVNATPRPLYPQESSETHCIGGWVGPGPFWTGAEKLAPTGIRSPDHPARSESLYRLRYSGPLPFQFKGIFFPLCIKRECGDWRYGSTQSVCWYYVELSGQLQDPDSSFQYHLISWLCGYQRRSVRCEEETNHRSL